MIKIYALLSDNGDCSASIHWFKDGSRLEDIMNSDIDYWGMNEGCSAETLAFPEDFDFDACGIKFSDDEF